MGCRIAPVPPSHAIGINQVSRRKGQVTVVYDLEGGVSGAQNAGCRVHGHVGTRRQAGGEHAINLQIVFDRFHMVHHLDEAVDAARRELWRQLTSKKSPGPEICWTVHWEHLMWKMF